MITRELMAPLMFGGLIVVMLIGFPVAFSLAALGLACGALAGPLAYLATPEWSVPLAGLVGGTAAYLILKRT